jgi:hypothetical protein
MIPSAAPSTLTDFDKPIFPFLVPQDGQERIEGKEESRLSCLPVALCGATGSQRRAPGCG